MARRKRNQAVTARDPRWHTSKSDIRINLGGGSLVGSDLDLTEEQADRAVAGLLAKAQTAIVTRGLSGRAWPESA
jgi:hypothetical protein